MINAIVKYMPQSKYPVLFIVSLAIGGLLGEKIHLEDRFKKFVTGFSNGNLAQGLSTAILLFCVGTLSILGPMESALKGIVRICSPMPCWILSHLLCWHPHSDSALHLQPLFYFSGRDFSTAWHCCWPGS